MVDCWLFSGVQANPLVAHSRSARHHHTHRKGQTVTIVRRHKSSRQAMRDLARDLGRFITKDFAAQAEARLNLIPKSARAYVAVMHRLGLIVPDGEVKATRGPRANIWKWVGDDKSPSPLPTAYVRPPRYPSVWHYANGASV